MKRILKCPIVLGSLISVLNFNYCLFSQTDSSKVSYSQESSDSSDYNYHRKYQYLDINLKEETKMFKIGIPTFTVNYSKSTFQSSSTENLGLFFIYERKFNPSLSLIIENDNSFNNTQYSVTNSSGSFDYTTYLDWGIRYYFLMQKRIKEGISGNNCNGLYVDFFIRDLNQFQFQHSIQSQGNLYYFNIYFFDFSKILNKSPEFQLNLGLQKRLNNYSFIDTKFFIEYIPKGTYEDKEVEEYSGYIYKVTTIQHTTSSYLLFGLSFTIGLGWGWK